MTQPPPPSPTPATPPGRAVRPRGTRAPVGAARSEWHARPLAQRLVAVTTGLLALGLAFVSVLTVQLIDTFQRRALDEKLSATAQEVAQLAVNLYPQGGQAQVPNDYYYSVTIDNVGTRDYVWGPVAKAQGRPKRVEKTYAEAQEELVQVGGLRPFTLETDTPGKTWRAVTLPLQPSSPGAARGSVTVALSTAPSRAHVARAALTLTFISGGILLAGIVSASYLVRRSLRPLREIEEVAGKIAGGDLSTRIEGEPTTTEVGSLSRSLNMMLERIEESFESETRARQQMQQFVSDASHELRTPLATVRGYAELYRIGGIPAGNVSQAMARIESEAQRMGGLVEDLLKLARLGEGSEMKFERIDLRRLAARGVMDLRVLDSSRPVELVVLPDNAAPLAPGTVTGVDDPLQTVPGSSAPVAVADADRLTQVITNLLGNVIRHTPAGSPVEIAVGRRGGLGVIEVRDHGPGIAQEARERVFERFYRTDASRSRESGGSGLGLAIVVAILRSHDGTIRVLDTPGGGATMRVEVPLAGPSLSRRAPRS
ncbi:sensor histidine kinase [Buchananella hordeovulneris]|uniref:sensor histidine kinase n=1 Tax=Buchananella hordeovulneris TaxID=52770 RepID=UPI0026DD8D7D|nr:HAMP domain-containing sensor histidine kinase [Buchananella hordeovulneris]MDO5080471.1 HAMP domain-containing sensor histidine kinase [Buchananella hordeovulneris]